MKGTIILISTATGAKSGSIEIENANPAKQISFTNQNLADDIVLKTRVSFDIDNPGPNEAAINIQKITQIKVEGNLQPSGDAKTALDALVVDLDANPQNVELEQEAFKALLGSKIKTSCESTQKGALSATQEGHWTNFGSGLATQIMGSNNGDEIKIEIGNG